MSFLGREIFQNPVSLSCSHCYCQGCLTGLKKSSSEPVPIPPQTPHVSGSVIYRPKTLEIEQCFVCAMCRSESFGYTECRDIQADLKTLETTCPNCPKKFILCELRKHLEACTPKPKIGVADVKKLFANQDFLRKLSRPQAEALNKARNGENRSTFPCPYCATSKYKKNYYFFIGFYWFLFYV